ncbi:MAG TPA: COX15/CtaA family protein [Phototrophicaceae bacterium]|nr:COX15/CtaA family protein [Phototrophicaceae bacterium]
MRSRLFPTLALITALLTVGLIVIGAVVRVSDSGLGCGDSWPLCNGTIFPPLSNITAWIEWTHRLVALLIGLFGLAMLVIAIRDFRSKKSQGGLVLIATIIAALLYSVQDGLGRAVVLNELNPVLVTVHLGTAMLLLGGLVVAAVASAYVAKQHYSRDSFTALAYVTTLLSFVIILTGALVRGSGATLACASWPLCNGSIFPADQGTLPMVSMMHRFAVVALGVALVLLVWMAWTRRRGESRIRLLAGLALVAYLCQAVIGAGVVFSGALPIWEAGHVLFAALTWALLIYLSVIESVNTAERMEGEWRPQSEALQN